MSFRRYRVQGALIGLGLLLAACGPTAEAPAPTPEAAAPAAPAAPPPEIAGEVLTFDGANSETIPVDPMMNYQVTFDLKSEPGQPFTPYSDTVPAMPILTSGFEVYLDDGRYAFGTGKDQVTYAGDTTRGTRVSVANVDDGSVLVVDGKMVWTGPRLKSLTEITVGKGYLNRTWKGKISRPAVCAPPEGATAAALAADPTKVGCPL
jgi:hypothetical protein